MGANVAAVTDPWLWWRAALAGKASTATTEPQHGYYRTRYKGQQWEPVAIWEQDGMLWALRSGAVVRDVHELWTHCLRHPITYEQYTKAMAGEGFDDEPPAPIGHNSGDADSLEALRIEFLGWHEQANEILKAGIKSEADADRASILKGHFLQIRAKAQALFRAEKQPVIDEGKRIDEKYRALAHEKDSEPTIVIELLRRAMEGFLREQKRAEDERQRKAREEAARLAHEAEEAARRAAQIEAAALASDKPSDAMIVEAADLAEQAYLAAERQREAEKAAEARKVSVGRTGATTSLRKVKVGVVTDYAKAAAALVAMQHKDIIACIDTLAQRAAKADMPFDGMEVRTEEKAV